MRGLIFAVAVAGVAALHAGPGRAAGAEVVPPDGDWSFEGVFGTIDRHKAQRGFQVFKEVCATCHSLRFFKFRNLHDLGYSEEQIRAIAAEYEVTTLDDAGQEITQPAEPKDGFPPPFPNKAAASFANNGAYPPDLSLIVKAREYGADHVYGVLVGYEDPPEGVTLQPGQYYNKWFSGHIIAMPQPIYPDGVTYQDGTEATVAQMAEDVTVFLAWIAEPHMEERKQMGVKVLLFLLVLTALLYAVKRKVWADVPH